MGPYCNSVLQNTSFWKWYYFEINIILKRCLEFLSWRRSLLDFEIYRSFIHLDSKIPWKVIYFHIFTSHEFLDIFQCYFFAISPHLSNAKPSCWKTHFWEWILQACQITIKSVEQFKRYKQWMNDRKRY